MALRHRTRPVLEEVEDVYTFGFSPEKKRSKFLVSTNKDFRLFSLN